MVAFLQAPETPIKETFKWQTDIMVSHNGTEQRVEISELPQRTLEEDIVYTELKDVRLALTAMMDFGGSFDRPLFAYQTRLISKVLTGASILHFNIHRGEMRAGQKIYIFDDAGGELATVLALTGTGCNLTAGLSRGYSTKASVAPVVTAIAGNNVAFGRVGPDHAGKISLTTRQINWQNPFVRPSNVAALTLLAGLPILPHRAIGKEFEVKFDTGMRITDFGGAVDVTTPWKHAQMEQELTYLCHRISNLAAWDWWQKFMDYAKGSTHPFWISTNREDFDLVAAPAPGGTTLTFQGTDYVNEYFPHLAFRGVVVTTAAGVHYATVSNAVAAGGNSAVTFTPALPVGAGWNEDVSVSLLLKCRIANDKVSCYHYSFHTEIGLALRTVDA